MAMIVSAARNAIPPSSATSMNTRLRWFALVFPPSGPFASSLWTGRAAGGRCCCVGGERNGVSACGGHLGVAAATRSIAACATQQSKVSPRRYQWSLWSSSLSFSSSSPPSSDSSGSDARRLFKPADPPGTHGTPVFPDVDLSLARSSSSAGYRRNRDPTAVFVVSAASRGIGLQITKFLVERTAGTVLACCRDPETATGLQEFALTSPSSSFGRRVRTVRLDVTDQTSVDRAAGEIERLSSGRVDVLWNVAGLLGDGGRSSPGPERSVGKVDRDWLERSLQVNLVGPVMLTKALTPLMMQKRRRPIRRGTTDKGKSAPPSAVERPAPTVVANLSARVGSISDNELGGWYSYRCSKAALNQFTRTAAHELRRHSVWTVSLHPGTTDTDLSKPFQANVKPGSLFPVEFTATQLLDIVDSLMEEHSGGLYDWSGQALSF